MTRRCARRRLVSNAAVDAATACGSGMRGQQMRGAARRSGVEATADHAPAAASIRRRILRSTPSRVSRVRSRRGRPIVSSACQVPPWSKRSAMSWSAAPAGSS